MTNPIRFYSFTDSKILSIAYSRCSIRKNGVKKRLQSIAIFLITILAINRSYGTSLDIALAFARYAGALFTFEEANFLVIEVMPDVNKPLDNIADALRLSPLAIAMANDFAHNLSRTLMRIAFDLIIFGYLIPLAIIILITILSCWYIREEIRNLYIMLVPFPIAKKACQAYLEQMDKKLIKKLKKQQEEMEKDTVTVTGTPTSKIE